MPIIPQWTYKLLADLPRPPHWLVSQINDAYRPDAKQYSSRSNRYLGIRKKADWKNQSYDWIQPMASNNNVRHYFNNDFASWIKTNIVDEFQFNNSGVMFFDEPQLPHTDVTRDFVLLYNVDPGGADSELCFWQENGQAIYRERMLAVERGTHLQKLDSVSGPFDCWYILNTRIIHSVENVSGLRLNLQVSFDTAIPEAFLKRYF